MEVEGDAGEIVTQEPVSTVDLEEGAMEVERTAVDIVTQKPTSTAKLMEELSAV